MISHLLKLHDVRMHEASVIQDLTFYVLRDLHSEQASLNKALMNDSCKSLTFSPLSMNFIATVSFVTLFRHSWTNPKVPEFKSLICIWSTWHVMLLTELEIRNAAKKYLLISWVTSEGIRPVEFYSLHSWHRCWLPSNAYISHQVCGLRYG